MITHRRGANYFGRAPQVGYDFPTRCTSARSARAEAHRLRRSYSVAAMRRDLRAAQYLDGRLARLRRYADAQGWSDLDVDDEANTT